MPKTNAAVCCAAIITVAVSFDSDLLPVRTLWPELREKAGNHCPCQTALLFFSNTVPRPRLVRDTFDLSRYGLLRMYLLGSIRPHAGYTQRSTLHSDQQGKPPIEVQQ